MKGFRVDGLAAEDKEIALDVAGDDAAGEILRLFAFRVMGFGEFGHAPEIGVAPFHSAENAVEGMEGADDAVVQQNQFVIVVERR